MTQMANSQMRRHIEEFFDQVDLDVVCHKRNRGYSIRWANDHEPFLRLRPTGSGDEVELFSWEGGIDEDDGNFYPREASVVDFTLGTDPITWEEYIRQQGPLLGKGTGPILPR